MRVLHTVPYDRITGAAAPTLILARGLAEAGHDVHLACRGGGALARAAEAAGVTVHPIGLNGKRPLDLVGDIRLIERVVRRHRIQIVHCHRQTDITLARLALGPVGSRVARIVATYHEPLGRVPPFIWRQTLRLGADIAVYVSRAMERRFASPRARFIPGAIDARLFAPGDGSASARIAGIPAGRVIVGMSSKLTFDRGIPLVMRAFGKALDGSPGLHLLLVGENDLAQCRELAASMGLADRVTLTSGAEGFVDLLRAMDFAVQIVPGNDGSARAAFELMALEKPMIAARVGALAEMIDDECGRAISSEDELASAIRELASDEGLRRALGAAGRKRVLERYDLPILVRAHEDLYREMLSG